MRLFLHDLLSSDDGFEANFGITGGDFEIGLTTRDGTNNRRIKLIRAELLDLISLQPIRGAGQYPLSWKIFTGLTPIDAEKSIFRLSGAVGATIEPIGSHIFISIFLGAGSSFGRRVPDENLGILRMEPLIYVRLDARTKLLLNAVFESDYRFRGVRETLAGEVSKTFKIRSHDLEVRAKGARQIRSLISGRTSNELSGSVGWFF